MKFKGLLVILVAVGSVAPGEINLKVGDPESRVLATLGQPQGKAAKNGAVIYIYEGGNVIAKDGKVIDFPKDFEAAAQRAQRDSEIARQQKLEQAQFEAEQKAKGLILYEKQWVAPEQEGKLEAANEETKQQAAAANEKARLEAAAANKKAEAQAFLQGGLRYKDIVLSPQEHYNKELTLRGEFSSLNTEQREFGIKQGDYKIDVSYIYLPDEQQAKILAQKNSSAVLVEVTGTLRNRHDSNNRLSGYYYIKAKSVSFYEPR
jgi:hypothetical protein